MAPGTSVQRLALAVLLCAFHWGSAYGQPRPAIQESVEFLLPMAPATVRVDGKVNLVYELHITNFLPVQVSLTRIQVKRADRSGASIADYRDDTLSGRIGRPGLRRDHPNPHVVGPGMRAIAYFWIALAEGSETPVAVRHRIDLDVLRQSGRVHAAVEGAAASLSDDAAVVLNPPLRGGPWVAIYDPALKGGHRTAIYTLDGRPRIPGRFAIDWIRLPPSGALDATQGSGSADGNGYGADVLAVADGIVATAIDDLPDNEAGPGVAAATVTLANASGNYVALDLGRRRFAFYEHLKHGSVAVRPGDRVKSGQVIARLGNSGSSSIGPHLHFHVSDANSPLAAEGLPFEFTRFDYLGRFSSIEALVGGERWHANPAGRVDSRRLERPSANSVIQFR